MTLTKRVAYLIIPIVFLGYALTAVLVYDQQKRALSQIEASQFRQTITLLKSEFLIYQSATESLINQITSSQTLAQFISEPDSQYRSLVFGNLMESFIKNSTQNLDGELSLSIYNPNLDLLYFYKSGGSPFSEVTIEEVQFAHKIKQDRVARNWHLAQSQSQKSLLIAGQLIDQRTLSSPIKSDLSHTMVIVVSVHPKRFDAHILEAQSNFHATVSYLEAIPPTQAGISLQLLPDKALLFQRSTSALHAKLNLLKLQLAALVALLSLLTSILLWALIRNFVTRPVHHLDQQLSLMMEKKLSQLPLLGTNDEVGRLNSKFYQLYQELNQSLEVTREMSRIDALTQLANRVSFHEQLDLALNRAKREKGLLTLIYLDLDNFKFVNDRYGHEVGDKLLQAFSRRIKRLVKRHTPPGSAEPLTARLSGDEFTILLPGQSTAQAEKLVHKVLGLFDQGFHFELGSFPVTASVGLASFPRDGHGASQLLSNADIAMYQAKQTGKNRLLAYSNELAKVARRKKEIEHELKNASFDHELHLLFMPIVDAAGKVCTCEALVRWRSPLLGEVYPDEFIPIAESTGLFSKVDLWVFKKALASYPELVNLFGGQLSLAINISSAELSNRSFSQSVVDLITQHQLTHHQIELEITETFEQEHTHTVIDRLSQLRSKGLTISIDDFGTGYTSIMQMVNFPADKIKFDKSFVARLCNEENQATLLTLIELCHQQQMTVTAEGVETEAQKQALCQAGIDFLQGYYFARPMSLAALQEWQQREDNPLKVNTE